jgi:predicted peptidase
MNNVALAVAVFLFAITAVSSAQSTRPAQKAESFKTTISYDVQLNHLVFLPADYGKEPGTKWPLMIFLHGAGERGSDIEQVKAWGPPKIVEKNPGFPFVLISPQCEKDKLWEPRAVIALLDKALATYDVDPDRVYLTGISMGGFGTWATAIAYPDRFAAILPICGGGDSWRVGAIKHVPTWVFHGEKDQLVPISRSEDMVNALKRAGGDVKFTRYPDAGHDSWSVTYDNPEVYEWLLSHKRTQPPK